MLAGGATANQVFAKLEQLIKQDQQAQAQAQTGGNKMPERQGITKTPPTK